MILRTTALFGSCALLTLAIVGCGEAVPPPAPAAPAAAVNDDERKIEAAINELPEEDRALARAQKFCAVAENGRLGSMGKPVKLMIDDKPVFLCCDGCEEDALKDKEATLAKVEKFKAANQPPTPNP